MNLPRLRGAVVGFALFSFGNPVIASTTPLPSFPGAEGFGAIASGGRGGALYRVTTLADSGPGSFRDAVSQPHRIVVFDVGGVIRLSGNVQVASDLTIAGQTAPGEGICLYGAGVSLSGKNNIVVRYLRFRSGIASDRGRKALGFDHASTIIIDHCSIEWGRWDNLGITVDSHDVTVQHCIIAEAIHPQSFGALIDSVRNVTVSHNLWMSNESRNPKAKGTIQYINNVVYNWMSTGLCGGHSARDNFLDVIGNYFIKGPSSNNNFTGQYLATDHVYQKDNLVDLDADGQLNGRLAGNSDFREAPEARETKYTLPTFEAQAAMHPAIPVTVQTPAEAYAAILDHAGCSRIRDEVDRRLIGELMSLGKKGATLAHTDAQGEALVGGIREVKGGVPPDDTDRDGLPDAWEKSHALNPNDPSDAAASASTGYTQIEIYINSLGHPPISGKK